MSGKHRWDPAREHGLARAGDIGRIGTGIPGVYHQEMVEIRLPRAEMVGAWAERMNRSGRYLCGCGASLVIRPRHRSMGLPRYVHGHHSNPLRRGFDTLRKKGYRLVGEVAKLLGVSENTVRRMKAEGVIPKAQWFGLSRGKGKTVRAFTTKEVKRIARSRTPERWRAKHPGR